MHGYVLCVFGRMGYGGYNVVLVVISVVLMVVIVVICVCCDDCVHGELVGGFDYVGREHVVGMMLFHVLLLSWLLWLW